MIIIPAVDIQNGKCVRLSKGDPNTTTVFNDNPIDAAMHWQSEGAEYLHIVDLDGAFSGTIANFKLISEIAQKLNIPAEIGGGIRTLDDIKKYIDSGIDRVILGTKAAENIDFLKNALDTFGEKIAVGIDASFGKVVVKGWAKGTDTSAIDLAQEVVRAGAKTIIYTDIQTDGMLKGPNIEETKQLAQSVDANIIASGGISSIEDINNVKQLAQYGVTGMIIGKALYTGNLNLKEII